MIKNTHSLTQMDNLSLHLCSAKCDEYFAHRYDYYSFNEMKMNDEIVNEMGWEGKNREEESIFWWRRWFLSREYYSINFGQFVWLTGWSEDNDWIIGWPKTERTEVVIVMSNSSRRFFLYYFFLNENPHTVKYWKIPPIAVTPYQPSPSHTQTIISSASICLTLVTT